MTYQHKNQFPAYLLVSTNYRLTASASSKIPGISLVSALASENIFEIIDTLSIIRSPKCIKPLYFSFMSLIRLKKDRNFREIFFYNFNVVYLFYYFILLVKGFKISLFLADGLNCIGIYKFPQLYRWLFFRIVTLSYPAEQNLFSKTLRGRVYWFPGSISHYPFELEAMKNIQFSSSSSSLVSSSSPYFLYNSSILPWNGASDLLYLANIRTDLKFLVTGQKNDFASCVNSNFIPDNITFIGILPYQDYLNVLLRSSGVVLFRDERNPFNQYNFPSKALEALRFNIPIISAYIISGLPLSYYQLIECHSFLHASFGHETIKKDALGTNDSEQLKIQLFANATSLSNLKTWISLFKP